MAIPREYLAAARKYGSELDDIAGNYRNPVTGRALSGTALLLKLTKGESGFDMGAVSNKGARGGGQFMPGTRDAVLEKTGGKVDPWRSPDEAMHAAVMHLTGQLGHTKGLEGYNPGGGQDYVSYILGQKVGDVGGASAGQGSSTGSQPAQGATTSTVQLPGTAGLDLTGLLTRLQPAEKPTPMGIAAPSFAAGQQFQSLPPTGQPAENTTSKDLASILASAAAQPSSIQVRKNEEVIGGAIVPTGGQAEGGGADRALGWVQSKVGFKETGTNAGGIASFLNQRFGLKNAPWCAMFTSAAVTKGGAPASARTASVAEVRAKAQRGVGYQRGMVNPAKAQQGDLILWGNDHIGMVEKVANGKITFVAGNHSNGVNRGTVRVGDGDIVRPKYGKRR